MSHAPARPGVPPRALRHTDRVARVSLADGLFLVAKNEVEAQEMTAEVVMILRSKKLDVSTDNAKVGRSLK